MSQYIFDEPRHIHLLNGHPMIGTTTALSVIEKPFTWWASGMACSEFGWSNAKKVKTDERIEKAQAKLDEIKAMSIGQYVSLLDKAYSAHNSSKKVAADSGIDLHSMVEDFIKKRMEGVQGELFFPDERMRPFEEWCDNNVKRFLFSEVNCYSERLWCGGQPDFAYEDMNGNYVLADAKSHKAAYFSDMAQLGGYNIQLSENGGFTEDGKKIFELKKPFKSHAVFHFGGGFTAPTISYGIERDKNAFEYALALYKCRQDFDKIF